MKSLDSCIKFNEDMFMNIDTDSGQENLAELHKASAIYLKKYKNLQNAATNDRTVDIQILKYAIKAQDKMISAYRTGKPKIPEWVFDALKKMKNRYGNDLQKII